MKNYYPLVLFIIASVAIGTWLGIHVHKIHKIATQSGGHKYEIYKHGSATVASIITRRDTVITPNGGSAIGVEAVDYICPCGLTGTIISPDSIVEIQ